MGDASTVMTEADVRHLLRRTGFGPTARDIKRAKLTGATRGQGADAVLDFPAKGFRPNGNDDTAVHNRWLRHLIKAKAPLQSKLALFWHDHFAVNGGGVGHSGAMADQVHTLYVHAAGNFKTFVKAMNKDIAMMIFLNTNANFKALPNENYPRELCELFTLGVADKNGVENYVQADIVQIARGFTGWSGNPDQKTVTFDPDQHDFASEFPERGPKILFDDAHGFPAGGASFAAGGEGEAEIDSIVDILLSHLDSDGMNTVARRIAYRLLEYFTHGSPDYAVVDAVVAESAFDTTWDIGALVHAILVDDAFWATAEPAPWSAATKKSVKWPIDYVVSTLRILRMKPKGKSLEIRGGGYRDLVDHLDDMGQQILQPPSVFGWDWETSWLTSASLRARYTFARDLVAARSAGGFKARRIVDLSLTDPGEIVDAVTDTFDVTSQMTSTQRDALIDYLSDFGATTSIDLRDKDVRNRKLHGLVMLVMESPAYQLH